MLRMMALVAVLLVCAILADGLTAQENGAAGDPFAEKAPARRGAERARTLFQAAQAQGLAPQVASGVDFEALLRQPTKFEFVETPLGEAIAYLATQHDVDIQLDPKGLTDAAVDPSAPVTRTLRKPVPLESGLNLLLDEFDLTFTVQDGVLKITSKERADEVLSIKVYPVGDLVTRPRGWGPLMNLIKSTIQPDSWDDNGGPATIVPFPSGGLLIVSHRRDVHAELRDLLAAMRAELAKPKDAKDGPSKITAAVYHLGGASGEQTAEAIKKLVAPTSWQGQGGDGEVCAISRSAGGARGLDLLLVRQTDDVHNQIQDLLNEFNVGYAGKGTLGPSPGGSMPAIAPVAPAAEAAEQPAAQAPAASQ
jgi:hypothetical protein